MKRYFVTAKNGFCTLRYSAIAKSAWQLASAAYDNGALTVSVVRV